MLLERESGLSLNGPATVGREHDFKKPIVYPMEREGEVKQWSASQETCSVCEKRFR